MFFQNALALGRKRKTYTANSSNSTLMPVSLIRLVEKQQQNSSNTFKNPLSFESDTFTNTKVICHGSQCELIILFKERKLSKGGTTNVTHVSAPETKVVDSSLDISSVNLSTIPIIEPKKGLFDQWISPSIFSELKTYLETMGGMNVFPS